MAAHNCWGTYCTSHSVSGQRILPVSFCPGRNGPDPEGCILPKAIPFLCRGCRRPSALFAEQCAEDRFECKFLQYTAP